MLRHHSSIVEAVSDQSIATVPLALEELLRSEAFRNSRQSEKLFRYLVQHSLDGRDDLLREKQVGVAVFCREPDYDTAADSIVRVRMNEIRKRLALYYQSTAPLNAVRFSIPRGAYKVEIVHPELRAEPAIRAAAPPLEPCLPQSRSQRRIVLGVMSLFLALVASMAAMYRFQTSPEALKDFWQPALNTQTPVILSLGNPVLLQLSSRFRNRNRLNRVAQSGLSYQSLAPIIPPEMTLRADDLVAVQNQYVGLGSAYAVARISSWLSRNHKETEIRFANDLSYVDLKRSAAVFIGAFQNRWTLQAMKGQRFVFDIADGSAVVRNQQTGRTWTLPGLKDDGGTNEDYIIITRAPRSDTGQFVVAAAGITQYGCQTAADVLTSSDLLPRTLNRVNPKWQDKTSQILLHVPVMGQTPGTPTVIGAYVW